MEKWSDAAVHEKCVEVPIVVVINPRNPRTHCFQIEFLRRTRPLVMKMNSRFACDITELHVIGIDRLAAVPQLNPLPFTLRFTLCLSLLSGRTIPWRDSRVFARTTYRCDRMAQQSTVRVSGRRNRNGRNQKNNPWPGSGIVNTFHDGTNVSKLLFSAL